MFYRSIVLPAPDGYSDTPDSLVEWGGVNWLKIHTITSTADGAVAMVIVVLLTLYCPPSVWRRFSLVWTPVKKWWYALYNVNVNINKMQWFTYLITQYFTHGCTYEIYHMLKERYCTISWKILAFVKFDVSNKFTKGWDGDNSGTNKKKPGEACCNQLG